MILTVPNVSEGRDPARIARLSGALASAATLLDVDPGEDAHRTVLTAVSADARGGPGLVEGLFQLARTAVETIDLNHHRGVHPRMGAIDVVPFVPLGPFAQDAGAPPSEEAAWILADLLSRRIAGELGVPVYRYGKGVRSLRSVRRGGFEQLRETMRLVPPDYGPPEPHPTAGAVAVGVRDALIAWNVGLEGGDLETARALARAVRASSGGFPGVEAIGWETPALAGGGRSGSVQVSMNITAWQATPPHVVYDFIADRHAVSGSELVGLIPEGALRAAAEAWGTDLEGAVDRLGLGRFKTFLPEQKILERRLDACLKKPA